MSGTSSSTLSLLRRRLTSKRPIKISEADDLDVGESDSGETQVSSHSENQNVTEEPQGSHQIFFQNLAKYKTMVRIAPRKQQNSVLYPKNELSTLTLIDHKHSHFAKTQFLSIHQDTTGPAKGYIECIRRSDRGKHSLKTTFVVHDQYEEPVVLAMPDGRDLHCKKSYVIYSRRSFGHECDLEAVQHKSSNGGGCATFYPWIRVALVHGAPQIHIWNGQYFEGSFVTPLITRGGKKKQLSMKIEGSSAQQTSRRGEWTLDCQAGADPALMLCLTVALGQLS